MQYDFKSHQTPAALLAVKIWQAGINIGQVQKITSRLTSSIVTSIAFAVKPFFKKNIGKPFSYPSSYEGLVRFSKL
jgi:hypothetical protein